MSSLEESNGTQFIWKIENFTCMTEKILPSPTFCSHTAEWEVRISTSPLEDTKMIGVSLHRLKISNEKFNCSLAFLDSDGIPLIWSEEQKFQFWWVRNVWNAIDAVTFDKFIKKSEMFGSRKTAFLPNDTLTVQCLIWQTPEELVLPLKCFARTRIEPKAVTGAKTFIWIIENASACTISETRVKSIGRNFASLIISLSFNCNGELEVTFDNSLFRANLKVKISVLNVMGKNIQLLNEEMYWKERRTLRTYITKTMLTFHSDLFLHQDKLSLLFTCNLSTNITYHGIVSEKEMLVNNPQPTVAPSPISELSKCTDEPESKSPSISDHSVSVLQALQDMYENFLSDCVLKIRSGEPPFPKADFGARSRFFNCMLSMKDENANCMDRKYIEEDTLKKLLRFVYSEKVEEQMKWESALKLYAAADMYALESLKRKCSAILRSGLCVSSVLDVLKLSDAYHDENLKSAALNFISRNDKKIVGSSSWFRFEDDNAALAVEALRTLYLLKMNS